MKKIENKKALLIVGVVDATLILYLILLLLGFFKMMTYIKEVGTYKPINYVVTNEIITSESSLSSDKTFHYYSHNDELNDNEELYFHSNRNQNVSIGTYSPQSYIYGTEDKTLYISFKLENTKVYKVTYHQVLISDMDGENVTALSNKEYKVSKKDGYFTFEYSKSSPKYIYALSLTYYVK